MSTRFPARWRRWAIGGCAVTVLFVVGCVTGGVGQPHMASALDHLQAAKSELQVASHDKGGHRVRAIRLIDDAIAEVQAGEEHAESR